MEESKRKLKEINIHFDNGDIVKVQDLPKSEYEEFLELMNKLRIAYIALTSR